MTSAAAELYARDTVLAGVVLPQAIRDAVAGRVDAEAVKEFAGW